MLILKSDNPFQVILGGVSLQLACLLTMACVVRQPTYSNYEHFEEIESQVNFLYWLLLLSHAGLAIVLFLATFCTDTMKILIPGLGLWALYVEQRCI